MNSSSIASCGVICDICLGFQRKKRGARGEIAWGPRYIIVKPAALSSVQGNRVIQNGCAATAQNSSAGESGIWASAAGQNTGRAALKNLHAIAELGMDAFVAQQEEKWKCPECGKPLCVHGDKCRSCGVANHYFLVKACRSLALCAGI